MSKPIYGQELRASILNILFRINHEEDSSNYVLGSGTREWCDEIIDYFHQYINSKDKDIVEVVYPYIYGFIVNDVWRKGGNELLSSEKKLCKDISTKIAHEILSKFSSNQDTNNASVTFFSIRKLKDEESVKDGEFFLQVSLPGKYAISPNTVNDLQASDSEASNGKAEAQ